jgi:hypothetical protein
MCCVHYICRQFVSKIIKTHANFFLFHLALEKCDGFWFNWSVNQSNQPIN